MSTTPLTTRSQHFVNAFVSFLNNGLETWLAPLSEAHKLYCRECVIGFDNNPTAETLEGLGFSKEEAQETAKTCAVAKAKKDAKALLVAGDTKSARRTLMLAGVLLDDINQFIADNAPKTKPALTQPQPIVDLGASAQAPSESVNGTPQGETNDPMPLFPAIAKTFPNWVTYVGPKDKAPKISGTFNNASSNDPSTWVDYKTACDNIAKGLGCQFLGFVTNGAQSEYLTGIDIDGGKRNDGVQPWVERVLELVAQIAGPTYIEWTPNGGLRPWVRGDFKKHGRRTKYKMDAAKGWNGKAQVVEVFDDGLYFTTTGNRMSNTSEVAVLDDTQTLALLDGLAKLSIEDPMAGVKKSGGEADPAFAEFFSQVGWQPLEDRMNKMDDPRYHELTLQDGKLTYCPMPGHGPRDLNVPYTRCFGIVPGTNGAVVHCFGCGWSGDMVKTMREFDGSTLTMTDYARALATEYKLDAAKLFPDMTLKLNQRPDAGSAALADANKIGEQAKQKASAERAEYEKLVANENQPEVRDDNPYPIEAWKGTPYYDFSMVCRANKGGNRPNYIPLEYFVNTAMTVTGAVCGNRITPVFNPTLQARFITVLLSVIGGIGKGEAIDWAKKLFDGTNLIYDGGLSPYKNIGCLWGGYGSGRGMLEAAWSYPRLAQPYGELTTLIEKVGIQGSGTSFLDLILNLADRQDPEWQAIKSSKIYNKSDIGSKEVSNSVIAGTTTERMDESMSKVSWETLIQRVNLVPSDEVRTVLILAQPDLTQVREAMAPRILALESHRLLWSLSPEAERVAEEWFEDVQGRKTGAEGDSETFGRIQTYLWRIVGHLALWLAPLPEPPKQEMPYRPSDLVWEFQVPVDLLERAIDVAEWQMSARKANMPTRGVGYVAACENLIKKWAYRYKTIRWNDLKERSHINRYGYKVCDEALRYLTKAALIALRVDPDDPANERKWFVVWMGKPGDQGKKKWHERRGRLSKKAKILSR